MTSASQEAVVRFDNMAAADANSNGEVTLEELAQVKLVDVAEGTYGTGSASHVDDLGAFVQALTTTSDTSAARDTANRARTELQPGPP